MIPQREVRFRLFFAGDAAKAGHTSKMKMIGWRLGGRGGGAERGQKFALFLRIFFGASARGMADRI